MLFLRIGDEEDAPAIILTARLQLRVLDKQPKRTCALALGPWRLDGQDKGARLRRIPVERGLAQVMLAAQNGSIKTCPSPRRGTTLVNTRNRHPPLPDRISLLPPAVWGRRI